MGRARGYMQVDGRRLWTLFDTGAINTYIVADGVGTLAAADLIQPEPSALGGHTHLVKRHCLLMGRVEGYAVSVNARVVTEIGQDEDHKRIEVLFGALAMQNYGIKVDPKNEQLDFTNYPKEFVEFALTA